MKIRLRERLKEDWFALFYFAWCGTVIYLWAYIALPWFLTDQIYTCDPSGGGWCQVLVDNVWGLEPRLWAILMGILSSFLLWTFLTWGRDRRESGEARDTKVQETRAVEAAAAVESVSFPYHEVSVRTWIVFVVLVIVAIILLSFFFYIPMVLALGADWRVRYALAILGPTWILTAWVKMTPSSDPKRDRWWIIAAFFNLLVMGWFALPEFLARVGYSGP